RSDVVVDERLWSSVARRLGRQRSSNRVVVEQRIARRDRSTLEPYCKVAHWLVDLLDENLGVVTDLAEQLPDEHRLVRDRVAVGEVRKELMDRTNVGAANRGS